MASVRLKLLALLSITTCLVAAVGQAAEAPGFSKLRYECEKKAAEYTYNLDKAGDQEIFARHLQECLEAAQAAPRPLQAAVALPQAESCVPLNFVNNSGEDIFLGVWLGKANRGQAPDKSSFPDWKLEAGKTRSWCAPSTFNGRFVARTGCEGNKCAVGDCCQDSGGNGCGDNTCTTGNQPASMAEFTLNDKDGKSWYNVSYVDGYNFPVQITLTIIASSSCTRTVGCSALPACPWTDRPAGGVCLAPYKLFEADNKDFLKKQQYFILAAKCASDSTCGCGNQCSDKAPCPDKNPVTGIASAGCSPLALKAGDYGKWGDTKDKQGKPGKPVDKAAQNQVVCIEQEDGCKFVWDAASKRYPDTIKNSGCSGAYTWQYDDAGSLGNCKANEIKGFTISFGKRAAGTIPIQLPNFLLHPTAGLSGTYSIDSGSTHPFTGPDAVPLRVKDGTILTLVRNCSGGGKLTCLMTYNSKTNFTTNDKTCKNPVVGAISWNEAKDRLHDLNLGIPNKDAIQNGRDAEDNQPFTNLCK